MNTIPLGPWPLGIDNVHAPSHRVFQPPEQGQPPARLREARDVNLDDDGWPSARPGTSVIKSVSVGKRFVQVDGVSLLQAGDSLYLGDTKVAANLVRPIETSPHADQVYWSDGRQCGRIQAGVAKNWGCSVCPRPIGAPGDRQVFAAFVDEWGLEHGLSDGALLSGASVTIPYSDPNAAAIRFYVATPGDDLKFWHSDVPVGTSASLSALPTCDIQAWTHGFSPPPTPDVIISHGDSIVVGVENRLYPSLGAATHLYDLTLETVLPEAVLAGMGVDGGFWVVTAKDAYWIDGGAPQNWKITPMYLRCAFAKGAERFGSQQIPGLGIQQPTQIAMFMSAYGPAFGLPGGVMLTPFRNRYHVNVVEKRMSAVLNEGNTQQLIFAMGAV